MLTKSDLAAIGSVIDKKLDQKLDVKLKPIHDDIKVIKNNVKKLQTEVVIVKTDVKKLRKDLDGTIKFFDDRNLAMQKEIAGAS